MLVAHGKVKHSGGLAFRACVTERRRVDVSHNDKSHLAGTWVERAREGAGSSAETSDGELEGFAVDALLWSRKGRWGFGIRSGK